MSNEKISIAELEHIVDFDARQDGALSGHADLEAYGKARDALPVLLDVVKAAMALSPYLALGGPLSDRLREALAKVTP